MCCLGMFYLREKLYTVYTWTRTRKKTRCSLSQRSGNSSDEKNRHRRGEAKDKKLDPRDSHPSYPRAHVTILSLLPTPGGSGEN